MSERSEQMQLEGQGRLSVHGDTRRTIKMTKKAKELFLQEVAWYHQALEKYHDKTEELCSTIDSVPVDHLSKLRLDCR